MSSYAARFLAEVGSSSRATAKRIRLVEFKTKTRPTAKDPQAPSGRAVILSGCQLFLSRRLRQHVLDNSPRYISQPKITAGKAVGEPLVIEPEQMQDCGM
jgi:hypothetical protein